MYIGEKLMSNDKKRISKKATLLFAFLLIAIIIGSILTINYYGPRPSANDNQQEQENNPPENPDESLLVIPESPLGTLGIIVALIAAFSAFAVVKKRRIPLTSF